MGAENTQPRFEEGGALDAPELQVIPFRPGLHSAKRPKSQLQAIAFLMGEGSWGRKEGGELLGLEVR